MPSKSNTAEKILTRFKGLRNQMQPGEEPLFTIPAIWDGGQGQRNMACDVILTNSRLFGYAFVSFPRERLFLDAITLSSIKAVSLRHKTYEPLFRELRVSTEQRSIFVRSPRQKIEDLYEALRSAIEQFAPAAKSALEDERADNGVRTPPAYGRQEIRTSFEGSSLGITILFVGGLLLEIFGFVLWLATHSASAGFPLFIAGLVAVITAFLMRRQRN